MSETSSLVDFPMPQVTRADVRRFHTSARISDQAVFAAELNALILEKLALARQATESAVPTLETLAGKARALRADARWHPTATDIQRGRSALLQDFEQPQNLPLPAFAKLANKSRQQIYKDLSATPKRLLALSVGPRGQRLPDWQLDPVRLRLTQEVLKKAEGVDAWTVFHALSEPLEGLRRRSAVNAVSPANLHEVVAAVLNVLGMH